MREAYQDSWLLELGIIE